MITDKQVRRLLKLRGLGESVSRAAARSDMDEKTARKYLALGKLPSESRADHTWRTREDPFAEVWMSLERMLRLNPGLEAKTLFADLQRRHPGRFQDGQLRTLQRKIKRWRGTEGPQKEVFFPQRYFPGVLCSSDFTHLTSLGVTIDGHPFRHLLYHFVLPYSNWETGTICFSESFESLSQGLQNALWELGGVPESHRSDRLTAAVNKDLNPEVFTERYAALLRHIGMQGRRIQAAKPNENGDVEQAHHRFKRAMEQSLLLRGSRDFASREAYAAFVRELFGQLNAGRSVRFDQERAALGVLPARRLEAYKCVQARVSQGSTVRLAGNVYSVNSRLIGERVDARLYHEHIEIHYGQRCVDRLPRLSGKGRHRIEYRHIIDWLVRKPGAFENYRYAGDLFPTHRFRVAYDQLRDRLNGQGSKAYLRILHRAATGSEAAVDEALRQLIDGDEVITEQAVRRLVATATGQRQTFRVSIAPVALTDYDTLLRESYQ